jgi:hypothetical protein
MVCVTAPAMRTTSSDPLEAAVKLTVWVEVPFLGATPTDRFSQDVTGPPPLGQA